MSSLFNGAISASVSSMNAVGQMTEGYSGNIANVNTMGYKGFDTQSQSVVSSTGASASGVSSVSRQLVDQQGIMTQTDVSTDLAIDGAGFFIVTDTVSTTGGIGNTYFTKAGSFRKNSADQFVNSAGYILSAWPVDASGNLPQTKSLISSLEPVNINQVVSQASATTTMDFGANLNAAETVAGGGVATVNIIDYGPTASPFNSNIGASAILYPNPTNQLTSGDGMTFEINGLTSILTYGGFAQSFTFTNTATDLVANGTTLLTSDELQFQVDTSTIVGITRGAGANNLEVLENIANQINQTTGSFTVKARVINQGATSTLLISPTDANFSLTFLGDLAFRNSLGFTDTENIPAFISSSTSNIVGRFASLQDFSNRLTSMGFTSAAFSDTGIGGAVTFQSVKPVAIGNYDQSGQGTNFMAEFGLTAGYLQSDYDPYDSKNNMSGGTFEAHFSQNVEIYDSLGNLHILIVSFLKLNTNEWAVEVYSGDSSEVTIPGRTDGLLQAGTVTFDGLGNLLSINETTQQTKSVNIASPNSPLGATIGQTLSITVGGATFAYTYGPMIANSNEFTAAGTGLVTGTGANASTDQFIVTVGSTAITTTRGTGTTNLAVLEDIANQINLSSGPEAAHASVVYDSATLNYSLQVEPVDTTLAVAFSESPTGLLGTQLNILAANNLTADSFETIYELAEQMNRTTGPDAIQAEVITGNTPGTYKLRVNPKNPSLYMSWGGTSALISAPLGNNSSTTIASALGLTSTSAAQQLASMTNPMSINWAATIGANASSIGVTWGNIGTTSGMSQIASSSAIAINDQNGVSTGQLNGVVVDENGYVIATFSNNQTRQIYKLAIADFANPNGLAAVAGDVFTVSKDSGPLNLKEAGTDGVGTILSGTLEGSNVDIAAQLTNLITAQRQYQASAKVINVVDGLMDDLLHRTFN
ncbi:MAG: flagellar hook-basal body complex protein [Rickettsiales bacterium]